MISLAVAAAGWVGVGSPGDYAAIQFLPLPRHDLPKKNTTAMIDYLKKLTDAGRNLEEIQLSICSSSEVS